MNRPSAMQGTAAPSLLVRGRRFLEAPRCISGFVLEPIRADGDRVTVVLLVTGRGWVRRDRFFVRFDATATANGTVAIRMPVTVGEVARVAIGDSFRSARWAFPVEPTAPATRVIASGSADWPMPNGVRASGFGAARDSGLAPAAVVRLAPRVTLPRVASVASAPSARLRRERLAAPRDPS